MISKKSIVGFVSVIAILFGLNSIAFALLCTGSVTPSSGCVTESGNDSVSAINNDTNFFDINDWMLLSKWDIDDGALDEEPVDIDLVVTVTADDDRGGTWAFDESSVWDAYSDVMIVLKASSQFSGFLLAARHSIGDWTTSANGLSHLTVYARGEGTSVPEPRTMLLLGTAIIGLAGVRLKRKS